MDVRAWLGGPGFERRAVASRDNDVGRLLPELAAVNVMGMA
jgi:hypothetical protein